MAIMMRQSLPVFCCGEHLLGQIVLSPVLEREAGQLRVVVDPFELQRPASLSHAGQHQPVAFQMELAAHRLCLEVGRYIIWEE